MSRCNEIINIRAEINKIENRKTVGKKNPMKRTAFCHSWGFGEAGAGRPGTPGGRSHLLCPGALTVSAEAQPWWVGVAVLTAAGCSLLDPLQGPCEEWEQLITEPAWRWTQLFPAGQGLSFLERPKETEKN